MNMQILEESLLLQIAILQLSNWHAELPKSSPLKNHGFYHFRRL